MTTGQLLRGRSRPVTPHPDVRRLPLAPGAHPAGLCLDEDSGLLTVAEMGTRRLSRWDARQRQDLGHAPLTAVVSPDLREQSVGGGLLPGAPGSAYLWTYAASGTVHRLDTAGPATAPLTGGAPAGAGLLRDWLFAGPAGVVAAVRGEPHLIVAAADLGTVRRLPLPAPAGALSALPDGQVLALLDDPEERACVVDPVTSRVVTDGAPWAALSAFPLPPARGPFLSSAPVAVSPDGNHAYVGCHRTDAAARTSPLVSLNLRTMEIDALLADERLATPSRLAVHPSGTELYVSGELSTLVVDTARFEVAGELAPGRLIELTVSASGDTAVGVDLGHSTVFVFSGPLGRTLTAPLTPDRNPTELLYVPVVISERFDTVYVADRFGGEVLSLSLHP
ncbi:hypothetical protein ABTY96_42455 [Streptomyces sp. NPDC096057]|uniref:hypothetical protein n=1 Tax=Streptomyces sp. NPDC096057 TaxID=3155543 RepID=UPI00332FBEE1